MGMTIIEKIFARKAGLDSVGPGDTVVVVGIGGVGLIRVAEPTSNSWPVRDPTYYRPD